MVNKYMKSQANQNFVRTFSELQANLLAAVAELDLKGTNTKVTQAMCIIDEAFAATAKGIKFSPKYIFRSGITRAETVG